MPERRPLYLGLALLAVALVVVLIATALRGPLNPACSGRPYAPECLQVLPILLMWSALPLAIVGAVFVAIWMGRRDAAHDEDQTR